MKKIFVFMAAFFAAVFFNSCSQKKWISDFDEGKKLAEKAQDKAKKAKKKTGHSAAYLKYS